MSPLAKMRRCQFRLSPLPPFAAFAAQVTATQGKDGTVTVNVQENMRNPYQPVGQGIASNVNINVNESGTNASVTGTVSGAPSFEANFTTQGGTTTNLPIQSAPQGTAEFIIGLQQTNQVNKRTELKKDDPQ